MPLYFILVLHSCPSFLFFILVFHTWPSMAFMPSPQWTSCTIPPSVYPGCPDYGFIQGLLLQITIFLVRNTKSFISGTGNDEQILICNVLLNSKKEGGSALKRNFCGKGFVLFLYRFHSIISNGIRIIPIEIQRRQDFTTSGCNFVYV